MKAQASDALQTIKGDVLSNPFFHLEELIAKKRRNLEKRKMRLQQYDEDERNGRKLSEEQHKARWHIGEVETQLEFMKDVTKMLTTSLKRYNRAMRLCNEASNKKHVEVEQKYLALFMRYQNVFKALGESHVTKAFLDRAQGTPGLEKREWQQLQKLRETFSAQLTSGDAATLTVEKRAQLAHTVLTGSKEIVFDELTGAKAKELLERVANCECMLNRESVLLTASEGEAEEECERKELVVGSKSIETLKADPKVVFVQMENDAAEPSLDCTSLVNAAEFGFENIASGPSLIVLAPVKKPKSPLGTDAHGDNVIKTAQSATTRTAQRLPDKTGAAPNIENRVKTGTVPHKELSGSGGPIIDSSEGKVTKNGSSPFTNSETGGQGQAERTQHGAAQTADLVNSWPAGQHCPSSRNHHQVSRRAGHGDNVSGFRAGGGYINRGGPRRGGRVRGFPYVRGNGGTNSGFYGNSYNCAQTWYPHQSGLNFTNDFQ